MANAALMYDKHAVIQKLEKRGFSHEHAEGIAEALTAIDASELATKSDLKDLELRLYKHMAGILIGHGLGTAALTVAMLQLIN